MKNDEWLTPPEIVKACGAFDLDPCAPVVRPWDTAAQHFTVEDDGLVQPWTGRVWCNPPFGREAVKWLRRMVEHGNGIALIPARTETTMFYETVWGAADAVLFIQGRRTSTTSAASARRPTLARQSASSPTACTTSQRWPQADSESSSRSLKRGRIAHLLEQTMSDNLKPCACRACNPNMVGKMMFICPTCGDKRCAGASDCRAYCTATAPAPATPAPSQITPWDERESQYETLEFNQIDRMTAEIADLRAALARAESRAGAETFTDRHGRLKDELRDLIQGMTVSVDVSTGEHDSGNRLFGVVNEVMDEDGDKCGVTLLVYDTTANFEGRAATGGEQAQHSEAQDDPPA